MSGDYRTETVTWQRIERPVRQNILQRAMGKHVTGADFQKTRTISVAQIGEIQDPDLRGALERQRDAQRRGVKMAMFIMAYSDDTFAHAIWVPIKSPGVKYTENGIVPIE